MAIQLDHLFILTESGAPQADLFSEMGLVEGPSNVHAGQGTTNRRFFFANSMLELLFVHDREVALNGRGRDLQLVQRRIDASASPFGLILKQDNPVVAPAFPAWSYYPAYLADDQCFHVGENSSLLEEPLCICMPGNMRMPDNVIAENPQWRLTKLRISTPVVQASQILQIIGGCPLITLCLNQPHRLELVFNDGQEGQIRDFDPDLPLVMYW